MLDQMPAALAPERLFVEPLELFSMHDSVPTVTLGVMCPPLKFAQQYTAPYTERMSMDESSIINC